MRLGREREMAQQEIGEDTDRDKKVESGNIEIGRKRDRGRGRQREGKRQRKI